MTTSAGTSCKEVTGGACSQNNIIPGPKLINFSSDSTWHLIQAQLIHNTLDTKCKMKTNIVSLLLTLVSMFYISCSDGSECSDEYPSYCQKFAAAGNCRGGPTNSTAVALQAVVDCRFVSMENIPCS